MDWKRSLVINVKLGEIIKPMAPKRGLIGG